MKIFIAGGAGTVGSCIAQALAEGALADEIVLYDIDHGLASNHAMDLLESVCLTSAVEVRSGSMSDLRDSDIVIPVINIGSGNDHMKNLGQTAPVLLELVGKVEKAAPEAVVITASNPVDIYNFLFYRNTGLPASRWLGFSYNDTVRFRRVLGSVLNLPPARVGAFTIGEHGPTKVPLFSSVEVDGNRFPVSPEQKSDVLRNMKTWWDVFINQTSDRRTAGWISAFGVAEMVRRIRGMDVSPIPCSCILDGQYGQSGVSLGVPAVLGRQGVAEILELKLEPDEQTAFEASAAKIRGLTKEVLSRY